MALSDLELSLDDMSGSAIKRLFNETGDDNDNDDDKGGGDYKDDNRNENKTVGEEVGGTSIYERGEKNSRNVIDGVKKSRTKLGKLIFEAKLDGGGTTGGNQSHRMNEPLVGLLPAQHGDGRSSVRIQQSQLSEYQLHQQQSLVQRSSDTRAASALSKMPLKKRVRIQYKVSSDAGINLPYYHATIGRIMNNVNIPTYHMGTNSVQPAAASKRSLLNYHHRSTNARSYKPMSRFLTGATNHPGISYTDGDKKMVVTKLIVSQIVAEQQNKLLLAASNPGGDYGRLFGDQNIVATNKRNSHENVEEVAGANVDDALGKGAGIAVPRVWMTRILGSSQTGGRWHVAPEEVQTASSLPELDATDRTTAEIAKKRAKFQFTPGLTETIMEDVSETALTNTDLTFVPYNAAIFTPHAIKSGKKLTPCKCESSMEEGEIERWLISEEFKQGAKFNQLGFDDPAIYSPSMSTLPRKKGKRQCTPHLKKKIVDALAISTSVLQSADEEIAAETIQSEAVSTSGAPFHFMSGGAAASSFVNTPMAFKFLDRKPASAPSPYETSYAPPANESPAHGDRATHPLTTTPSVCGNLVPPTPSLLNCVGCRSTHNLDEAVYCTSCPNAKKPGNNCGTGKIAKNNKHSVNALAVSTGAGALHFGGEPSSSDEPASSVVVATVSNPFTTNIYSNSKSILSFSGSPNDLFKLKPDEWKCGTCGRSNWAIDSKCGDCGTSREGGEDLKTRGGVDGAAFIIPKSSHGAETGTAIGACVVSFAGTDFSNTNGPVNSGRFSFGVAIANPTSASPTKPKRKGFEASEDDSLSLTPMAGFNFGEATSSSPTTNARPARSIGFTFGTTATHWGDEKKEDPVTSTRTSNAGGLFGAATAETRNTIAPTSIFSFGFAPQPIRLVTDATANKVEAFVPSSTKAMLSVEKGSETSSTAEHLVTFLAATATKENSTPSTQPTLLFGNMTASTAPAPSTATEIESSTPTAFSFREQVTESTAAQVSASLFSFGAPAAIPGKNNDRPALFGQTSSTFESTPSVALIPSTQRNAATSVSPFLFCGPAPAAPPTGGSSFAFSSVAPTTSTRAQSNNSIPASTACPMFSAASNTSTFGLISGGFGSASQSATLSPVPTKPETSFSCGVGSTPTPAGGGFKTTPDTFRFGCAPTQPMEQSPTTGTFVINVASNPTPGFSGNQVFCMQPTVVGCFTPQSSSGGSVVGSFSIGTGDMKTKQRRFMKAKRPQKKS